MLMGAAMPAQPAAAYSFQILDYPRAVQTQALGINDAGQIVGSYMGPDHLTHGFLWAHGKFTSIDYPGAAGTVARGINAAGAIVGTYTDTPDCGRCYGQTHSFLWSAGTFTTLPEAPRSMPGTTQAYSINRSGQIVGNYTDPCLCREFGFVWSGGVFTTIVDPGFSSTVARGINDSGQIVGYGQQVWEGADAHGYLLSNGTFTSLDNRPVAAPDSGSVVMPQGINNRGDVAGYYRHPGLPERAFILSGGTRTEVNDRNAGSGSTGIFGSAINSAGHIVGYFADPNGIIHGFSSASQTSVVYQTGFEPPAFSPGELNGQSGWSNTGLQATTVVETSVVASGSQAVEVSRTTDNGSGGVYGVPFDAANQIITFNIDANFSTGIQSFWTVLNTQYDSTPGNIDFNIDENGQMHVYTTGTDHPTGVSITRGVWNHYQMDVNFQNETVTAFYNGVPIVQGAPFSSTGTTFGSLAFYCQGTPATDLAYFDNLSMTAQSAPTVSVVGNHSGNFTQGQQSATYTVTVSNASGAPPTSGPITVTDTLPSGLTLVGMSGTGWNCSGNTCTRNDVLNPGANYLPITVTVNVAANAPSPLINQVTVAGGGYASNSAIDSTTITAIPQLSVAKTHAGSLFFGQQGMNYTVTVSNAAVAAATTGTVTVTDTIGQGMTFVAMSGAGWSCSTNTCTRSDALNPGASYPAITVTVNLTNVSPATNAVTVSGGGSASANATDSSPVSSPSVSIVCSPSTLSFTYTIAGAPPPSESCSITSTPSGISFTGLVTTVSGGNWLAVSPGTGVTPATLAFSVNTLGLAAGVYTGQDTLTIGGAVYNVVSSLTVNPPPQVTFSLTPSSTSVPATASTGTTSLALVPNGSSTSWTTASTATWLHITSPASGTGSGAATIGYSVDANFGAERIGTFNVSSGGAVVATFTVDQAASSCASLSVSPTSFTFGASGGTGVLTFNTAPCPWTASTSDTTLVTGLPTSGNTGTITFGVAAGTTAASATITIPSTVPPATVTVTRTAPVCTYTIATPGAIGASQSFLAAGGTGSVNVTAPTGCAWTASSSSPFLTVTGGALGSGSGSMSYSVSANTSSTSSRAGTLTVAGIAYSVNQTALGPQSYSCTTSVSATPTMRAEGIAEQPGDVVVTCSGVSSGSVTGDVLVTLNTSLTNHTLNADPSGQTTDALLLVDEPSGANLSLTGSRQNVYRGTIAGPLAVRFKNVSLAPETGSFSHTFRITNVRVDASHLGTGTGLVTAAVSILSAAPFSVIGSAPLVGFVEQGSSFTLGSPTPAPIGQSLPVTFEENLPTAYRIRLATGQDPSAVGVNYNSESGYVNSAVLGNDTGFATNATRLVVRFTNIPTGTHVFVPVAPAAGSAGAQLVSADSNGVGGSPTQGSAQVPGYQPVALVNGSGTATWEITASSPTVSDTLTFNLLLDNASLALQNSCAAGSAPSICGGLGPEVAVSAPGNTAPVPRFVNPTAIAPAQVMKLSIAPFQTAGQTGSTSSIKSPAMALSVHRTGILIPAASGNSGNTVAVGGTVTIGEILQSDASSPPATNACVGTTLPPSYTITSCSGGNGSTCTQTGSNQVSTCYTSFDPGQVSNITVTADTTDTSGTAEIDSSAVSDQGNFGAGSFSQAVSISPGAVIALSFQGPSGIAAGKTITYSVSLNNTGAAKLAGDPLIVTITPDSSLAGVTAPVPGVGDSAWTCTPGATIVCMNTSAVAAGGQTSFAVTGNVPLSQAGGVISTAATLTLGGEASARQPVNTSVGQGLPGAVTLLSPTNGAVGVSTSPSLTWSAATGATSYAVNFGTSNPPPLVFNTSGLTYSPAALTAGTTYYWQITATNSSGSTPSAVWSFTAGPPAGFRFVPVTPCRVMDTRSATGTFGGPSIAGGATRNVPIPQSACNIPATAQAYSLNITVVPPGPLTYLSIWPTGQAQPGVSTLNSLDGRIVANAAIVPAGTSGAISVFVSNTTDVIIDINGYFAPISTAGSLSFYSAAPCRVVDTRNANGAFGGPFLSGGSTRSFTIPSSSCGIPGAAQAYSLNVTVVPHGPLQYLTTWPTGQTQPLVSTAQCAGREYRGQRGHCAGRDGRRGQRIRHQRHRCDHRHQWLLCTAGIYRGAVLVYSDALPRGGHSRGHRSVRRSQFAGQRRSKLRDPVERLQRAVHGAGLLVERDGGAAREPELSDGVAYGADAAGGLDLEFAGRQDRGQCGHRSGGHGGGAQRLRLQHHRCDSGYQRVFRAVTLSPYSTLTRNNPLAGAVGPDRSGSRSRSAMFPLPASISVPTRFRTMCLRNPLPRIR